MPVTARPALCDVAETGREWFTCVAVDQPASTEATVHVEIDTAVRDWEMIAVEWTILEDDILIEWEHPGSYTVFYEVFALGSIRRATERQSRQLKRYARSKFLLIYVCTSTMHMEATRIGAHGRERPFSGGEISLKESTLKVKSYIHSDT